MTDAHEPDTAARELPATATALLELQRVDRRIDQLAHQRDRLSERDQLEAASSALSTWERERMAMRARIDELTSVIERSETGVVERAGQKQRLEAQLKTVIAPREAEALMHEIAALDEQTDALETVEIEALEEQSEIDDRLIEHLRSEAPLRGSVTSADAALQRASDEIDAELTLLAAERTASRAPLDDSMLARYDRVRAASGVAVAQLVGHRCDGCHLDLSAAEVDDVKDEAASSDGIADCPSCGRMLVV